MNNTLGGWRAFIAALLVFTGTAIGHYFPATPTPAPRPTDIIVVPPQPAPIPSPNTTIIPVVPPAPVPVNPPTPAPVIVPPVPVNPPTPIVVPPTPSPTPITDLASLIGAIDAEFTQSESQKGSALALLTKLQSLLQGVETKHGLLPAPTPVPIPTPINPTPTPVNPPVPVNPIPVVPTPAPTPTVVTPTGFRVIIVFDPMANNTRDQLNTIYSTTMRDYLNSHCVKGADGRPEWRMWAPSLEVGTKESPTMVALWNATKSQMGPLLVGSSPQLVISVNGAAKVYPLPATEADTLSFLKQQGGN